MTAFHGEYKLPGGKLTVVDFDVAGGIIENFSLAGDFFVEPDEVVLEINRTLNGMRADSSITDYRTAIDAALPAEAQLLGVTPQAIGVAVRRALTNAATWRDYDWEIVHDAPVSPVLNSALDEVMTQAVGTGLRKPTLRIWESTGPAVYIGSFQSLKNEVDTAEAEASGTAIVRRISGGGAMYMVPENCITYAIFVPESLVRGLSFEESYAFLDEWVIEGLQQLGIDARYVPLNDIAGPNGKIGGAAQKRLGSGGILHHVTMAYDIDPQKMTKVLRIGREKLSDKGIKSAQKRVDPLRSQTGLSREAIVEHLIDVFKRRHGGEMGSVTAAEMKRAEQLVAEKFSTKEWLSRVP
ncbi:lipoyl protein ligase domain-containing protein [Canibacter zhoujuaniae]|uniref:lipoyl protein ligase domain-containing protein n=1 Tax=Canibacter zhoujuaniae TaxID=2708343 RepID=UPI0014247CF3|nr:lipoate--protein ligase family protein [Canibacter zhoujuaniae]